VAVGHGLPALGGPCQCKLSLLLVAADLDTELSAHRGEAVIEPWRTILAQVHRPAGAGQLTGDTRSGLRRRPSQDQLPMGGGSTDQGRRETTRAWRPVWDGAGRNASTAL